MRLNLANKPINVTKTCSNAIKVERNALFTVIYSTEKNDAIALESVLVKRISKECLTMFNTDGSLRKTAKSKLLQDNLSLKFLQHTSALLIWGLYGYLHLQHLMIVMRRQIVRQTTYGVITSIKLA